MTKDERNTLMGLISAYGTASEDLGAVDGSYGWNAVYFRQEAALQAVREFLNSIERKEK
jgi:hypothetical protein